MRRSCAAARWAVTLSIIVVAGWVSVPAGAAPTASSGAAVRVVNLVTVKGKATRISVYDRTNAGTGDRALARLAYGSVSAVLHPVLDEAGAGSTTLSFYRPGSPSNRTLLGQWTETLHAGDQVIVLVTPADSSSGRPVLTLSEWEHGGPTPLPQPTPGKALVLGNGYGLHQVGGPGGLGVQYGIPGRGCLAPPPDSTGAIHFVGGTDNVALDVDPGAFSLAAFDVADATCVKRPVIHPVRVDVQAGDRVYVLAFGTSRKHLKLVSVPIPTSPA